MHLTLPADIEALFIEAAADLSGRDPGQLDAREAIRILQEYGPEHGREKPQGDLYRELTDTAAEIYFSNPQHVEEWQEITENWDGEMPELLALTLQRSLSKLITREARKLLEELPQDDPRRDDIYKILAAPELPEEMQAALEKIREALNRVFSNMATASGMMQGIRQLLESLADTPAYKLLSEIDGDLAPFIEEELKKPQYGGKTIDDLLDEAEGDGAGGFSETSLLMQAVNAARAARDAAIKEEIPQITYNKKNDIALTIGKGSVRLFDPKTWAVMAERGQVPGQMSLIPVKYERDGEEQITLYCGMTESSFRSALSPEDYFYLSFIGDAYLAGNRLIAISKFYREVTGARGNSTQLRELYNKLGELQATPLVIRDGAVRKAWDKKKGKNPDATYKEIRQPAAPITMGAERYVANGGIVEAVIKIHEFPAILKVDYDIGQYTTVPKSLLQVKHKNGRRVKRTPRYFAVLHYLIHRIARIKAGKQVNKILYSTFYNDIGETTKEGRRLALDMLYTILDHFKREGWITGYKEETTESTGEVGVKFTWDGDTDKKPRKKRIASKKKGLPGGT